MPLPLERQQATFAAALIDATHAPQAAAELAAHDARTLDRLALYRGNVLAAREKALANAYPVVRALVGAEFFGGLARAYGREHPSVSGDLNRFGAQFSQFVREFPRTQSLPYLGDVAALEWCVHRAHYAADSAALMRDRITSIPPGDLLASRFALHAACAWLDSPFPVTSLWLAHQPDTALALPTDLERGEFALVARPRWHVEVLASSVGEIAALQHLQAGFDMECAIGVALGVDPRFDFPRALVRWLDQAILVDIRTDAAGTACASE